MRWSYRVAPTAQQQEALDEHFFAYGLDDYIWFENGNTLLVTENPKAAQDLEAIFAEINLDFTADKTE